METRREQFKRIIVNIMLAVLLSITAGCGQSSPAAENVTEIQQGTVHAVLSDIHLEEGTLTGVIQIDDPTKDYLEESDHFLTDVAELYEPQVCSADGMRQDCAVLSGGYNQKEDSFLLELGFSVYLPSELDNNGAEDLEIYINGFDAPFVLRQITAETR